MKLTLIGSHLCQDTLYALIKLKDCGAEIDFQDISSNFAALKTLMNIRETSPLFDEVKRCGGIGMPLFVLEDGTLTHDLASVLAMAKDGK